MQAEHLNEPIRRFANAEFTALSEDLTVAGAFAQIRERGVAQQIVYFYVVNAEQQLVGVLPTRRLLLAPPDARLQDIMINRVVAIPETATVLETCEMFLMHRFLAFPVVNDRRQVVGVVNVGMFTEETLSISERAHLDEVFERIGVRVAEVLGASPLRAFRLRFPWLTATLCGGIGCAMLAGLYETTLAASLILAFFLTLVLGLGESVNAQSVTVTVETLRGRRPNRVWLAQALRREFVTALLLGTACGSLVGLVAWLWRGQPVAALVIGASVAVSMVAACLIGLIVPSVLHRFHLDPRIAAGPVSLALTDLCTLLTYFSAASLAL
jgi:magnesium transporter